jgi:hypothetical protein
MIHQAINLCLSIPFGDILLLGLNSNIFPNKSIKSELSTNMLPL